MCSYIVTLICLVMFVNVALGQGMPKGAIGFPEIEENPKVSNKQVGCCIKNWRINAFLTRATV